MHVVSCIYLVLIRLSVSLLSGLIAPVPNLRLCSGGFAGAASSLKPVGVLPEFVLQQFPLSLRTTGKKLFSIYL